MDRIMFNRTKRIFLAPIYITKITVSSVVQMNTNARQSNSATAEYMHTIPMRTTALTH